MPGGFHADPDRRGRATRPHGHESGAGIPKGERFAEGLPTRIQPLHIAPVLRHVDAAHPQSLYSALAFCFTRCVVIYLCPLNSVVVSQLQPYQRGLFLLKS